MTIEFKDIVALISALAWPVIVLILLVIFRTEIQRLLDRAVKRATKLSAGPVSVEFAASQIKEEVLSKDTSPEAKAQELRLLELAQESAQKFDFWMKRFRQPKESDSQRLLAWLVEDRGVLTISRDYDVFAKTAQVLSRMGYKTIPAPLKSEFDERVREYDSRE